MWNTWLVDLTPHRDDSDILVLAAANNFQANLVKERYGEALEEILGRRIVVRMYPWAGDAARDRERKERRA